MKMMGFSVLSNMTISERKVGHYIATEMTEMPRPYEASAIFKFLSSVLPGRSIRDFQTTPPSRV